MIDLNNIEALMTAAELCAAYETTYDPALNLSGSSLNRKRSLIAKRAHDCGCYDEVYDYIERYEQDHINQEQTVDDVKDFCECDRKGMPLNTIDNYVQILANDPRFKRVRLDEMSRRPVIISDDGGVTLWTDAQDAACRSYIEKNYGIHSAAKCADALEIFFKMREYNPVKDVIESITWDGVTRIPFILNKWMGVEDSEYTREVSRLIFAGGIHRLYHPGCKFEDMPVLIGGQGAGKSSFVRFLAIEDKFFSELTTLDGKEGSENIEGSWIVEVSELLALTKTKEQEAVKSYLSRLTDKFRPAYGRRVEERRRTCIFIGTSNREQFIVDKTGGRRFYPVHCSNTGYWLFDHEVECREYIRQCWAEALANIDSEYMAPYARREIRPQIEEKQAAATEDDYRVDMIESYLSKLRWGDFVCSVTLWKEALGIENKEMARADQTQIGLIMRNMPGWKRTRKGKPNRYGMTHGWVKEMERPVLTYDTPNDDVPF